METIPTSQCNAPALMLTITKYSSLRSQETPNITFQKIPGSFSFRRMTSEILFSIHSSKLQTWLKEIQPMQRVADIANDIITSTLDMYFSVRTCFNATSHSPNFIFSFHDIHKVFQGMYLWRPRLGVQQALQSSVGFRSFSSAEKNLFLSVVGHVAVDLHIARLWMHECLRTFGDRLASEEACGKFISILAEVSEKNFGTRLSADSQTPSEDTSSPTGQSSVSNKHSGSQQWDSTPSQLEENVIPLLGSTEVQTEREESYVVESDSSLFSPGIGEDGSSFSGDGHVEREPGTSESKSESATESSSCSFQMMFSSNSESGENINQKPAARDEFLQLLQETTSSIQNVIFSPELCEPLNDILRHHHFKRNCVYLERDVDMLMDQLVHTIESREENKMHDTYYSPKWAVHHQNIHQLVHVIRAFLIPGGHGALFGATKKAGRKTTVRLAAALTGYQLIEVHPGNETKLWEMMKEVWIGTGVDAGHLVLLVHENTSQAVKDELLVMMANGILPGLFSDKELKNVKLRMKTWSHLRGDQALEM